MNKPFRNLAIAAITIELLLSGPRVCAQTNSWQQDMEIISAARAAAAASPVPISEQYIPTLNSNPPPPGLLGNYFSLQLNTPPLPYPQWGLPTYLIYAANAVYLVDDTAVDYADLMPPLGGIMPYSFNLAGFYTPTPFPPVCGTGGPAYITNFNTTLETNNTTTVSFVIAGGISNELYDIFFASNILSPTTVWQWLAHGEPCDTYEFTNQPAIQGYYKLARMATNNSTGTDFWLAYMYLTSSDLAQLSLYISSPFATTGTVTIPLLDTTNSFTLAAGEVTNIPIDTRVIIGGSDGYGDDDDTNQTNHHPLGDGEPGRRRQFLPGLQHGPHHQPHAAGADL